MSDDLVAFINAPAERTAYVMRLIECGAFSPFGMGLDRDAALAALEDATAAGAGRLDPG